MEDISEEQKKEFREAFKMFDKKDDGYIQSTELGVVMRSLGQNPTEKEVNQIVNEVDADGSGTIDLEEFCVFMASKIRAYGDEDDVKEAMRVFDRDQTGVMQVAELRWVLDEIGAAEKLSRKEIRQMLAEADSGANGQITLEDFRELISFQQ